jgi:L-threonylcarbamoyladenylate synthase
MSSTPVLPIGDPEVFPAVQALLARDGIFVAPTDTVYGVFCRYDAPGALARIYEAKDRPPQKAIPILIGAREHLDRLVQPPLHGWAARLMARFWPGPLTLVLPAQAHLPVELTAGARTVAVRMPDHEALRGLLRATGPLAATSANRSGQAETHSVDEVLAQLDGRVDLILADDDPEEQAAPPRQLASTIVDLSDPAALPHILREGPLGAAVRRLFAAATEDAPPSPAQVD